MATRKQASEKKDESPKSDFVELVHPTDDSRKETPQNATTDAQLRFNGWLPAEQAKLEAPQSADSDSSTLADNEKTAGSNS